MIVKCTVFVGLGHFQNYCSMSIDQNAQRDGDRAVLSNRNSSSTSSNQLIWPRRRGRKRKRTSSLNFGKIYEIFPGMDTSVLCQLSELEERLPSKVRELVPEASAVQIAAFMNLVEEARQQRKKERREASRALGRVRVRPEALEPVSSVEPRTEVLADGRQVTPKPELPSDQKSEFVSKLKKLLRAEEGGNGKESVKFSNKFEDTILNLLEAVQPKEFNVEHFENVYKKLLKDPLARSQLENLHAARAFKYGYAQFGPKYWYKETKNIAKKFKSQSDRRKFRMGLKGLVDFINQLNIMDLEKLFEKGEPEGFKLLKLQKPVAPETFCKYLEHVPPLKLIEFVNQGKATKIRKALKKISSLAHFSQSMTDYFARDDALEPALAVICEGLRDNEDIGGLMEKKAASFLSWAQPYEKERSAEDHDVTSRRKVSKTANKSLLCFNFQNGTCRLRECHFKHSCRYCGSAGHGEFKCPEKNRKKNKKRSRSYNAR